MKNAIKFIQAIRDVQIELPFLDEDLRGIYQELSEIPRKVLEDNHQRKNGRIGVLESIQKDYEDLIRRIKAYQNMDRYNPYKKYKTQMYYVLILCLFYKKQLFALSTQSQPQSEPVSIEQNDKSQMEEYVKVLNNKSFSIDNTEKGEALYYLACFRDHGILNSLIIIDPPVYLESPDPEAVKDNQVLNAFMIAANKHGHARSYYRIAWYYENGLGGLPKHFEKAMELYKFASEKLDDARAHFRLAKFHSTGYQSISMNPKKAADLYKKVAHRGPASSKFGQFWDDRGASYDDFVLEFETASKGVEKLFTIQVILKERLDKSVWLPYIQILIKLKDLNLVPAITSLGAIYEHGLNELSLAIKIYHQAAEQGCPEAQNRLGVYYRDLPSEEQSKTKLENDINAHKYFSLAANSSHAEALYHLGYCSEKGLGTKQDWEQAKKYYKLAVKRENRDAELRLAELALIDAQLNLARCIEFGIGMKQDLNNAYARYRSLVEQGVPQAVYALGRFYEHGKGRDRNLPKAIAYYKQAVDLGCKEQNYAFNMFEQVSTFFKDREPIIGKYFSVLITEYGCGQEDLSLLREKEIKEKEEMAKLEMVKQKEEPTKKEKPKKGGKKRDKCLVM